MEHSKCAETIKNDEKTKKTTKDCMLLHSCIKCYRNKARRTQSCGVPCFNIFLQMFSLLLTCFKYNNMTERKEKQVYAKHFLCTRTLQTQHDSVFLDGRCLFSLGLGCDTSISVSHEITLYFFHVCFRR